MNQGWTKHELGWIDNLTGLLWHSEFQTKINHYDAEKWASEQGKRLPTQEEFVEAEKHGVRVLKDMAWKDHWFWSSSLYPGHSDVAYGFYGGNGSAYDLVTRNDSTGSVAARCVSRYVPGVDVDSKLDLLAEPNSEALKRISFLVDEIQKELKKLKEQ